MLVMELVDANVPTSYVAECLYSRHGKGACYVRESDAMNRAFYDSPPSIIKVLMLYSYT